MNIKRPNELDWLIYRIFCWWWNPIFNKNKKIGENFLKLSQMMLKRRDGTIAYIPSIIWWK